MRRSMSHFDQMIRQNRFFSWLSAWCAVHGGTRLDDFLQWRKRLYEALYRLSLYPLPDEVVIEQGKLIKIPNREADAYWDQRRDDPTGEESGEPFLTRLESDEIARDLDEIEHEAARNTHQRHEAREQEEALAEETIEAIRTGAVLSPRTKDVLPETGAGRARHPPGSWLQGIWRLC
jgi:hypothetical protein